MSLMKQIKRHTFGVAKQLAFTFYIILDFRMRVGAYQAPSQLGAEAGHRKYVLPE